MKMFLKVLGLTVWILLVLATGYYLVFNNLSTMLAAGKVNFQVERECAGFRLKVGKWVETFKLDPPVRITAKARTFILKNYNGELQVTTSPKIKIRWKSRLSKKENKNPW